MSQLRKTWLSKPLEGALADASAINARADHALLSDPKIRENNHHGQPANSGNSINAFKRIDKDAPRRQGWRTEAPLDGRPKLSKLKHALPQCLSKLPSILAQILVEAPTRTRHSAGLSVTLLRKQRAVPSCTFNGNQRSLYCALNGSNQHSFSEAD